ncbi:MAG: NAD(P)/FAD-dependent oxidoreductase [Pirellulales bacterium]
MQFDAIVIGAGAAGLLAGARAAERGRRVLLLEKNRRPGVKILMSGGTRCNLTHDTDAAGIVEAYGKSGCFLHSALAALSPADLVAVVEAEGVATKVEPGGKVFPVSNRATDVLAALMQRLDRSGATLATGEGATTIERSGEGFRIGTSARTLETQHVLITTGGKSYPGSGTTGDGYAWAAALGHTIVPPRPALTPITTHVEWVRALQGVTVGDVLVRVVDPALDDAKRRVLAERRGSFLFAHFGLSGPAPMDVSRAVTGHARPATLQLVCDFLPDVREHELDERLRAMAARDGKRRIVTMLPDVLPDGLPARLVAALAARASVSEDQRAAELSKNQRAALVTAIKRQSIAISGTRGFAKAEVTAGGVSLDEVDSRSMQSKLVAGLFFAGEILDLDGPIGGYNFQAAFSTGYLAGEHL